MTRYEYDPGGIAYSDGRRDGAEAERNRIVALANNLPNEFWEILTKQLRARADRASVDGATATISRAACSAFADMIAREEPTP